MSISNEKIEALYENGDSCAVVARKLGCSETAVYRRLKDNGIRLRNKSEANRIFSDSVFVILYNIGLSTTQIGKILGVDSSTVTKRLRNIKFPLRYRGVAHRIRYTEEEFDLYFMTSSVIDCLVGLS